MKKIVGLFALVSICCAWIVSIVQFQEAYWRTTITSFIRSAPPQNDYKALELVVPPYDDSNLERILEQEASFWSQCKNASSAGGDASTKEDMLRMLASIYNPPDDGNNLGLGLPPSTTTSNKLRHQDLVSCPNMFIDFGANIGDSLVKFINAGLENELGGSKLSCPQKDIPAVHFDMDEGRLRSVPRVEPKKKNALTKWAYLRMQNAQGDLKVQRPLHPTDYCYLGIEGNPVFTDRLRKLERRTQLTLPSRPVRNAQFLTETVGFGSDGPTVLYLDTINAKHNFWGSSVMENHVDVAKSAEQSANKTRVEAPVTGITLSRILRQTVLRAIANAPTSTPMTSHVMIKIDIEGAEYALMQEALDSGVLCACAHLRGVRIDMLVEAHPEYIFKGNKKTNQMKQYEKVTLPKLKECGIHFLGGDGG